MKWLITGGAGYIGAHVTLAMTRKGHQVIVLDNLSSGKLSRVPENIKTFVGDIRDQVTVERIIMENGLEGIINLAALKSVEDSFKFKQDYVDVNYLGTEALLQVAKSQKVKFFLQSSTAAVYGFSDTGTVSEASALNPVSPYGETKLLAEKAVKEFGMNLNIRTTSLRYFNVLGSESRELQDTSAANIVPMVMNAINRGIPPQIFGDDYLTEDGTCVRDYVHVVDIARAHALAAECMMSNPLPEAINLGTGRGSSVREVVSQILTQLGSRLAPEVIGRRAGDPATLVADVDLADRELGFKAELTLTEMIKSSIYP